jgi:predicted SAM-dependent methyltransferase
METTACDASARVHDTHADAPTRQVFAQNTGLCMESVVRNGEIALNLGCGGMQWPGWVGVDLDRRADTVHDIRTLPFEDNVADRIAAIHVLAHLYPWEIESVMKEWVRVLKPGGWLIVELPCMDKVFRIIADCLNEDVPFSPTMVAVSLWGDPHDHTPAMTHKWGYCMEDMRQLFAQAGLVEIGVFDPLYHFLERDMRIMARKELA